MKAFRSITAKLIYIVIGTILIFMITLFIIADLQLNMIIDKSQNAIYEEKIDIILSELYRHNKRLHSTGLAEAYEMDFKILALNQISENYYLDSESKVFPFILDRDSRIILHHELSLDSVFLIDEFQSLSVQNGNVQTHAEYSSGNDFWYIYKSFEPWGWTVVYSIPIYEKYKDVIAFRKIFSWVILVLTLVALLVLIVFMIRIIKPIRFLSKTARNIARGNLNQIIELDSRDEIGSLASSFRYMQCSIKQKIEDLNQEIEDRLKVEMELSQAKSLISGILESMPSVLIAVDTRMSIIQWNGKAELFSAISSEEALGRYLFTVFPWLKPDVTLLQKAIETGELQYSHQRESHSASDTKYNDITIYPLSGQGLEGAVIRIDDVTEKRQLEERIAHSRRMDAIGQLAGGVAHDFNNMLAGISGAASLLKCSPEILSSGSAKYVQLISDAALRAAELTSKLLAFSRDQSNEFTSFSLNDAVQAGMDLLERTIDKNIRIHLGADARQDVICGDFSSVQNALMNLIINASHAMPAGGDVYIAMENIRIEKADLICSSFNLNEGFYIKLELRDTGTGIAPENLGKIFEPFFTTKDVGKGTGMGLASVYGIVQNHKGAISVDSELGKGTTFNLYFPCSESAVKQEEKGKPLYKGTGVILFIDDESILRMTMQESLMKLGYSVLTASDGISGLDVYRDNSESIDLVISDMVMPGFSGLEIFHKIRALNPDCPVIIASGFTKDEYLRQLMKEGLTGFIRKPFNLEELSCLIKDTLILQNPLSVLS